jgi:hypothetical protein
MGSLTAPAMTCTLRYVKRTDWEPSMSPSRPSGMAWDPKVLKVRAHPASEARNRRARRGSATCRRVFPSAGWQGANVPFSRPVSRQRIRCLRRRVSVAEPPPSRGDLTDTEWHVLNGLLPPVHGRPSPRPLYPLPRTDARACRTTAKCQIRTLADAPAIVACEGCPQRRSNR